MKTENYRKTIFVILISVVGMAALFAISTLAWFTNNSRVETNTASGKSGESNTAFLIGTSTDNMVDTSETTVEIPQVNENETDREQLLPVSTVDLKTFYYCPGLEGGKASKFVKLDDEKYYFHGRIYIEMSGDQLTEDNKYKIYLDTSENGGGVIVADDGGHLLSASRLGLQFADEAPIIFQFEDDAAAKGGNTVIDSTAYESGYVLDSDGKPVTDPAVSMDSYSVDSSDSSIELPENALTTITANNPVELNVYFYLEGCDENCIDAVNTNKANMHLAFYAVADTES